MEEEQKDEVFSAPSQFEGNLRQRRRSPLKKYLTLTVLIVVIGILIFGVLRFLGGSGNSDQNQELTPTPTIEEIPTDTPEPTVEETPTPTEKPSVTPKPTSASSIDKSTGLDRAKLSIHVLNGSGVAGASRKAADYLEGLGYNVVQVGNADNFDYADTQIQIKSSKSDFVALLKKDLSANYTVGSTSDVPPADETADAIVIIGKK